MERIALSLASTGVYGNPYAIPTGPSAHVSPGYAVVLAGIFRAFGTGVPGEVVKQFFACAVTALQCALMPVVAARFLFNRMAGLIAGVSAAVLPLKFITETQGDWESNWAALALMLIAVLTVQLWTRRSFTPKQAVWNGLGWGLGLLIAWSFAPLYGAVLVAGLFVAGFAQIRRYTVYALVTTGCVALCLAPWIIRNYRAFGRFIPGRTNTGIELRVSNNDQAEAREGVNFWHGVYHLYHPLQSEKQARRVLALGEVEFNRQLTAETFAWIKANPARFARLTAQRFAIYWFFPDWQHLPKTIILWTRTMLAFAGLAVIWRANLMSARVLTLILLVVPLPNYLVHVALKHSYPIDWIFSLLASVAVAYMISWLKKVRGKQTNVETSTLIGFGTSLILKNHVHSCTSPGETFPKQEASYRSTYCHFGDCLLFSTLF